MTGIVTDMTNTRLIALTRIGELTAAAALVIPAAWLTVFYSIPQAGIVLREDAMDLVMINGMLLGPIAGASIFLWIEICDTAFAQISRPIYCAFGAVLIAAVTFPILAMIAGMASILLDTGV